MGSGPPPPSPLNKITKNIGLLSNTGLDPLKNHKATKQAFTVEPSSARQFRWRADNDPLIVLFGSSVPSSTKNVYKTRSQIRPPMTKRSGSAHVKDWAILEPCVQTDESPLEFNPRCKIR